MDVETPARPHLRLGAAWWACTVVLLAGVAWVVVGRSVLLGGLTMAASFVLAGALRAVLPPDRATGLHIRGPRFDVGMDLLVAASVAAAAVLVYLREGA